MASTDQCSYCGFGEPRVLDHYLPRSLFGELAIYPRNLVPSCSPCNNAKRSIVPGLGPAIGPSLIHTYYQELPEAQFLRAHVTFNGGALKVSYQIEADLLEGTLAAKLQFQLERLKLNDRYKGRSANSCLSKGPQCQCSMKSGPIYFLNILSAALAALKIRLV